MISSDEARLVMSKWKNESSPIWVMFTALGEMLSFPSAVLDVLTERLILDRYFCAGIWLDLTNARFEYSEPREAAAAMRELNEKKFERCLRVDWPNGGRCFLFELRCGCPCIGHTPIVED